jgi:hypothetical protein
MAEESNGVVWDSGLANLPLIITLEAPLSAPPPSLPQAALFFANGSGLVLEPAQAWQVAGEMDASSSAHGADWSWPLGYGPHGSHSYKLVGDALQPYGPYRASFRFRSSSPRCTPGVVVLYEAEIYDPLHVQASEASILVRGPHASSEATWGAAKSDRGSPWVSLGLVNLCGPDGYLAGEVAVSYGHASLATPLPSLFVDAVRFVRRTPAVTSPRLCSDVVSRDIFSMDELPAGTQQVKAGERLRVTAGLVQLPSLDIYGELHVVPDGPLFWHVGRITVSRRKGKGRKKKKQEAKPGQKRGTKNSPFWGVCVYCVYCVYVTLANPSPLSSHVLHLPRFIPAASCSSAERAARAWGPSMSRWARRRVTLLCRWRPPPTSPPRTTTGSRYS